MLAVSRTPLHLSRSALVALVFLSLLAALAAPGAAQRGGADPAPRTPPGSPACPDWRWIGIRSNPAVACPAVAGWAVQPLFEDPSPGATIPAGLRSFCLYEHPDHGADLAASIPAGLSSLERDCFVVGPAASPRTEPVLPILEEHFLRRAGVPQELPAPPEPESIRLAVLDTAPTNQQEPELDPFNSRHGYSLVNMARKLTCDPAYGACAAEVTSRLALAWVDYQPWSRRLSHRDEVRGGYVGSLADLAQAVRREVIDWGHSGQQRLVMNLSLGWSEDFGGGQSQITDMPLSVQAVHRAMEDAVCRGALLIAAAGNHAWGPDPAMSDGPLLPAAWEERRAPSLDECSLALQPEDPASKGVYGGRAAYKPLLFAAAGLGNDGGALRNARIDAWPRLAAFADHAAVEGNLPAEPLTGSSVASLVVAATAATAWAYAPGLEASELLEGIYAGGQALSDAAGAVVPVNFCFGDTCAGQDVRRVRLCPVARSVCERVRKTGCPRCASSPAAFTPSAPGITGAVLEGIYTDVQRFDADSLGRKASFPACPPAASSAPAGQTFAGGGASPSGEVLVTALDPSQVRTPCPRWQLPDQTALPWVGPQPGSDPCPGCEFDPRSGTLYIAIDPSLRGVLTAPTMSIGGAVYALPVDLVAGSELVVTNLPSTTFQSDEDVIFSVLINGQLSSSSPILVLP